MAQPQILRSVPIAFGSRRTSIPRPHGSFSDAAHALMNELLSVSPSISYPIDFVPSHSIFSIDPAYPDVNFPGLPPLHTGTADEVIHTKVAKAIYDTEDDEPNGERAFFAADLSKVLLQHERWLRCLPGIEPFYGESALSVRRT